MPSCESLYGSFATDRQDASHPWLSRPCIGLAPGPNGSPLRRPSGVLPVALPYTTLDVMVSTLCVCVALRYDGYIRILFIMIDTSDFAMSSARSSLLPKQGNSPSVLKSTMRPR